MQITMAEGTKENQLGPKGKKAAISKTFEQQL